MKRQIRRCCFETNSSSSHTVAILTEDEWAKWVAGCPLSWDGEIIEPLEYEKELLMDLSSTMNFIIKQQRKEIYEDMIRDVRESVWFRYIFSEPLDRYSYNGDDNDIETSSRVINGQTVYAVSTYHYG